MRTASSRGRQPGGGAGGPSAGGRGPGGGGGRKGGPGAGLASRSSAGEQANSRRQLPALIAAPPRGAAPARAPLAPSPRQWARAGPSPRPRTAPATRARGRGARAWGPGAPGGGGVGGPWGPRGRDRIGGRERQSVREIPITVVKCLGTPPQVPGSPALQRGGRRALSQALAVAGSAASPHAAAAPCRTKGAGVSAWVGGPQVPAGKCGEGGSLWARAQRAASTCPSRRGASCRSRSPSVPQHGAGAR